VGGSRHGDRRGGLAAPNPAKNHRSDAGIGHRETVDLGVSEARFAGLPRAHAWVFTLRAAIAAHTNTGEIRGGRAVPAGGACNRSNLERRKIMRKFKMGLITLAASAALIPAGLAQANPRDHNDGKCNGKINVLSCFTVNDNEIGNTEDITAYIIGNCVGVAVPVVGASAQCGSATIVNLGKHY
jgi:hypothetical protein